MVHSLLTEAMSYFFLQSDRNICRWPVSQVLGSEGLALGFKDPVLGFKGPVLGFKGPVLGLYSSSLDCIAATKLSYSHTTMIDFQISPHNNSIQLSETAKLTTLF